MARPPANRGLPAGLEVEGPSAPPSPRGRGRGSPGGGGARTGAGRAAPPPPRGPRQLPLKQHLRPAAAGQPQAKRQRLGAALPASTGGAPAAGGGGGGAKADVGGGVDLLRGLRRPPPDPTTQGPQVVGRPAVTTAASSLKVRAGIAWGRGGGRAGGGCAGFVRALHAMAFGRPGCHCPVVYGHVWCGVPVRLACPPAPCPAPPPAQTPPPPPPPCCLRAGGGCCRVSAAPVVRAGCWRLAGGVRGGRAASQQLGGGPGAADPGGQPGRGRRSR
jgi:hypothetical protein